MKVVYVSPSSEAEKKTVTEGLVNHTVVFADQAIDVEVPAEYQDAEVLSIFVDSTLSEASIDAMPNLQVLALRSMGFDHVPVAYAKEKGISVVYVPTYGAQTVAEHTFALILALSRKAYPMYQLLRERGARDIPHFEGFDLCGRTLGVIGTGNIGSRICEIAQGFRMSVVAYDPYPKAELTESHGVTYASLEEVLAAADILTLHVPATPDTTHILNQERIQHMKPGAYVVNTARGALIDTMALIDALKSGHLAGAGLDVYEGEAYFHDEMKLLHTETTVDDSVWRAFAAEHELLDMDSVIMTPHMAFNTKEAKREIVDITVANITSALAGEPKFPVRT